MCVMKPKMLNLRRHFFVRAGSLLLLLLALRLGLTTARADAVVSAPAGWTLIRRDTKT